MRAGAAVAAVGLALCGGCASAVRVVDRLAALESGEACRAENVRPMVGVLTQMDLGQEIIEGSYVKYLEAAGARVVPVRYAASEEERRRVFDSVNGIFFPGGGADLSPGHPYFDASAKLFKWTLERNAAEGNTFPLWGTCLGFEQLNVLAAGSNDTVLTASGRFNSESYPAPVTLSPAAARSNLFGTLPAHLVHAMTTQNITYNAHTQGIAPEVFRGNPRLSAFFDELATYVDKDGKQFVAAVEARNGVPVYGVQFHPEKAIFEWHEGSNIPHEPSAIALAQWFANFFVSRARCNSHHFPGGARQEAKEVVQAAADRHEVHFDQYFAETYVFTSPPR